VKEQMADPTTQASIRDASLAACAQLPAGIMQETCTTFVEQYGACGRGYQFSLVRTNLYFHFPDIAPTGIVLRVDIFLPKLGGTQAMQHARP
jgi:hypothetical protein